MVIILNRKGTLVPVRQVCSASTQYARLLDNSVDK